MHPPENLTLSMAHAKMHQKVGVISIMPAQMALAAAPCRRHVGLTPILNIVKRTQMESSISHAGAFTSISSGSAPLLGPLSSSSRAIAVPLTPQRVRWFAYSGNGDGHGDGR